MSDSLNELKEHLVLGQIAKEHFAAKQREFDSSNPYLTKTESRAADFLQSVAKSDFDKRVERCKNEGKNFDGMDLLELRLWAPDFRCAMILANNQLMNEYNILYKIALSSGLIPICPGKVYYLAIIVGKMDLF